MENTPIVITGGTGYIGSHTAVHLLEKGYDVVLLDNLVNSEAKVVDRIAQITGKRPSLHLVDLQNEAEVKAFFAAHQHCSGVIHFAALKAVKESVEQPVRYYKNNLFGLLNLVEAMEENSIPNLIFSSSATVYGVPDELPLREEAPTKAALSPYGNTKLIGEQIIHDLAKANSTTNIISLRYFNPIGAHHTGLLGELPNGVPNNLMPFITQTAIGLRPELLVFGGDYDTTDGTAIRDYIHIEDLAAAHALALERLLKGEQETNYEVFNLGSGKGFTVLEVIDSFQRTSQQALSYRITERRAGDVPQMFASASLAAQKLGWEASKSLDDMTRSAWIWEQKIRGVPLESND